MASFVWSFVMGDLICMYMIACMHMQWTRRRRYWPSMRLGWAWWRTSWQKCTKPYPELPLMSRIESALHPSSLFSVPSSPMLRWAATRPSSSSLWFTQWNWQIYASIDFYLFSPLWNFDMKISEDLRSYSLY